MKPTLLNTLRCAVFVAVTVIPLTAAAPPTATARIVAAANTFIGTLDAKQKQSVMYSFSDREQRARWSNFPIGAVPRGGIKLGDMTPAQRTALMSLLSTVLSPKGFEKVQQIMEGDEVLKTTDGGGGPGGGGGNRPQRGNGGPPPNGGGPAPNGRSFGDRIAGMFGGGPGGGGMFGKDLYFVSFLGTPSEKTPWMLQFGGHHLALNITIAGDRGVLTPTLTGAQPAMYTVDGKTVRPLGQESDKALALLNSLDEGQKKQAVLGYQTADLVLGPGQDGRTIQPEGLNASAMNDRQRTMLLDVISEWAGIVNDAEAATRMAQLKADINSTWFAWSGPTTGTPGKNITAYYRIQGPHLVIEYAPQGLGGDLSMHVHTMYRDPTNDYGKGITGQ